MAGSAFDAWGPITRYFPGWELHVVPQDLSVLESRPGLLSSPGQERHLVDADGVVWTHVRKSAHTPAFLERLVRTGSPLYVFNARCPHAGQVAASTAWSFWLAHRHRLDDGVGVIDEDGEWRLDPDKDATAFIFEEKAAMRRLILMEFGHC